MARENKYTSAETRTKSESGSRKEARRAREARAVERMNVRNRRKALRQDAAQRALPLLAFGAMFLGICTISYLATGEQKTFYSLLLMLQDVPAIDFGWLDFGTVALELPSYLVWLEVVVQFFAELVQVVGFFLAGIAQALLFVLHFLRWIFL